MNQIIATEIARTSDGASVLIHFADENDTDLLPGDRFYDVATYDADPQAVIANFAAELDAKQPAVELVPSQVKPVTMAVADIEAKQAELGLVTAQPPVAEPPQRLQ